MFSEYRKSTVFKNVQVGDMFICNGTLAQKTSSRTAIIYYPAAPYKRFYYRQNEMVKVIA